MHRALDLLTERLGDDMSAWSWGGLHKVWLPHLLTDRGDLGRLLDRGGEPASGNGFVVCNTGSSPEFESTGGANYRLIVDVAESPACLVVAGRGGAVGAAGQPTLCGPVRRLAGGPLSPGPLGTRRGARNDQPHADVAARGVTRWT